MTEPDRRRLRRHARIMHGIVQLFLFGALCYSLIAAVWLRESGNLFRDWALSSKNLKLFEVVLRIGQEKVTDLMAFPPPVRAELRPAWAQRVRTHMGFPVAVFAADRDSLYWATVPEYFLPLTALVPAKLQSDSAVRLDTLGSLIIRKAFVRSETAEASLICYKPLHGGASWGVLLRYIDGVPALFENLARAMPAYMLDRGGELLAADFQLAPLTGAFRQQTGLRAFRDGDLLFATPDVDTTALRRDDVLGDVRIEYYLSDWDQGWAALIEGTGIAWALVVVFAGLMYIIFRFHRWVRKLTASSPSLESAISQTIDSI